MKVPLASNVLRPKDIQAATEVLNSGNLTMGERVLRFESEMAAMLGVRHFVMVNSGSSANLAIFEALLRPAKGAGRLKKGDSVIVPAVAWPTTVWPIIQLGLDPVFVDVEPDTLALDLEKAEEVILNTQGKRFAAIFPIHPLGLALDQERYLDFAEKYNLILVNDVCESLGASRNGKAAGAIGLASSYSFYFSHHLTTMEGGGIGTNDDDVADDLRSIRSHGWSRDRQDADEHTGAISETDAKFLFVSTGYNIRPMEIQAAIGSSQLPDLSSFVSRRRQIARAIHEGIQGTKLRLVDGGYFDEGSDPEQHSWMLIPIAVTGSEPETRRNKIIDYLRQSGIDTRPVLTGNFLAQPSVRKILNYLPKPERFPVASLVSKTHFLVAAHHDLEDGQVSHLVQSLKSAE
jgi:CDP-6-deoxy-D-xylo-4-hexulose-3-dehydrase